MLRIYLSSTFDDLKDYRREVADGLRKLGHHVVGMEDYVAEGSRPLAKCVRDVAESDLDVGIFAHRYGYVPDEPDNPGKLSITELELEAAKRELGPDRCLVFLIDTAVPWPPAAMDSHVGANEGGKRIADLKTRLGTDFTASFFRDKQELAKLVNTAVSRLPPPPERHVRQLTVDALIAYADSVDADADAAQAIATGLGAQRLVSRLVPRALFARSPADFRALEKEVVQCHSALLLVTPTLLGLIQALPDKGAKVVEVLQARTGAVVALLKGVAAADLPPEWPISDAIEVADPLDVAAPVIRTAIEARCPTLGRPTVGLPYIVLAMTGPEAAELFGGHDAGAQEPRFVKLTPGLMRGGDPVLRYGAERKDWKPFGGSTAEAITAGMAARLNDDSALGQRSVKLQYYPFGPWLEGDAPRSGVYRDLLATGCIAVVDQVSLFHSHIGDRCAAFLGRSDQVAVVAMSPPEHLTRDEVLLIEREAQDRLAGVFSRFDDDLDPSCEFGVAEERRLRRWLRASVPTAVNNLAELRPDEAHLDKFRRLRAPGDRRMGAAELLWPGRAP